MPNNNKCQLSRRNALLQLANGSSFAPRSRRNALLKLAGTDNRITKAYREQRNHKNPVGFTLVKVFSNGRRAGGYNHSNSTRVPGRTYAGTPILSRLSHATINIPRGSPKTKKGSPKTKKSSPKK